MNVFDVTRGDSPVVIAQPHGGTCVPDALMARLNTLGQGLADTDWHITRLYDGLIAGATTVTMNLHRYVIDANRDPSGMSLYPGQNTTTLCPLTDFNGQDIWRAGLAPSMDEIEARRATYHTPYHDAVAQELDRVKAIHGVAVLYDCHSIRSEIPHLFDGILPTFSIGTYSGASCAKQIEDSARVTCEGAADYKTVLNDRFKGGWTTRQYGQPDKGVHAIQMELAQCAYMDEAVPWTYRAGRADKLRPVLCDILNNLDKLARSGALTFEGA